MSKTVISSKKLAPQCMMGEKKYVFPIHFLWRYVGQFVTKVSGDWNKGVSVPAVWGRRYCEGNQSKQTEIFWLMIFQMLGHVQRRPIERGQQNNVSAREEEDHYDDRGKDGWTIWDNQECANGGILQIKLVNALKGCWTIGLGWVIYSLFLFSACSSICRNWW